MELKTWFMREVQDVSGEKAAGKKTLSVMGRSDYRDRMARWEDILRKAAGNLKKDDLDLSSILEEGFIEEELRLMNLHKETDKPGSGGTDEEEYSISSKDIQRRDGGTRKGSSPVRSAARRYYRESLRALGKAESLARFFATGNDPALYQEIHHAIKRHAGSIAGLSVFELASAQGSFLIQLKHEGALVSGLDINPALSGFARLVGKLDVVTDSVQLLPPALGGRTFDVTFSRNLLDLRIIDARTVANNIFNLTRPGGWSIHQTTGEPRIRTQDFLDAGFELTEGSVESRFVVFHRPVGPDRTVSSPASSGASEERVPTSLAAVGMEREDRGIYLPSLFAGVHNVWRLLKVVFSAKPVPAKAVGPIRSRAC
jgi:hypothetical protein